MMINTIVILLAIIYSRWIAILFFCPIQYLNTLGQKCSSSVLSFCFRFPYRAIQRITNGGMGRLCIFTISTFPSCFLRKLYYRIIGCHVDKNVVFHFKTEIRAPWNLKIGEGTIIGDNALLDARSGLTIGNHVNISSNVSIYSLQHNHRDIYFGCNFDRELAVIIQDRVWLGANVIILPGVIIGEGAVVCAGAVVTKNVMPFTVVAGIPAQKVGVRPNNISYEFNGNSSWFY